MGDVYLTSQELGRLHSIARAISIEKDRKYVTLETVALVFVTYVSDKYVSKIHREICKKELNDVIDMFTVGGYTGDFNVTYDFETISSVVVAALQKSNSKRVEVPHFIAAMSKVDDCIAIHVLNKYVDLEKYFEDTCSEDVKKDVYNIINKEFDREEIRKEIQEKTIALATVNAPLSQENEQLIYKQFIKDRKIDVFQRLEGEFRDNNSKVGKEIRKYVIKYCDNEVKNMQIRVVNNAIETMLISILFREITSRHMIGEHKATGVMDGDYITLEDVEMGIQAIKREAKTGIGRIPKYEEIENTENIEDSESNDKDSVSNRIMNAFCPCVSDIKCMDKHPFVGRKEELDETLKVLCRKRKNNALHVGEPGVGKTAIVDGLVEMIKQGNIPDKLKNAKIYKLDIMGIVAGTKMRGQLEERLKVILASLQSEYKKGIKPIVYIDEIHTILKIGDSQDGLNIGQMIKEVLDGGNIRFIGSTTTNEYIRIFSRDTALNRRFKVIDIEEPSKEECLRILKGCKKYYEEFHSISVSDAALKKIIELTSKYMKDSKLPDKALDILDEIGALRNVHPEEVRNGKATVKIVEKVVAKACKIPEETAEGMSESEADKIMKLNGAFKEKVYGQDNACKIVDSCIKLSRAGLCEENKPIASLLFVGPTGVGKTELARTVSTAMGISLLRFDMSEYSEQYSVSKLIGSAPGYIGYEKGGILVDKVREHPNSVVLFDEIEKAHESIYDLLLQIMDNAELTDSSGRKADFRHIIVIMTSNAGAQDMQHNKLGFTSSENKDNKVGVQAIDEAIKKTFKPEFLNRLTEIVKFNYIGNDIAKKIVEKKIASLKEKLQKKKIGIEVSDNAIDYILQHGVSTEFGAREINRIVDKEIGVNIANFMFSNQISENQKIKVECTNGTIEVLVEK